MTDPQSIPPEEESPVDPTVVRWIPYVPLGAALIVLGTYVIYAVILTQAV
jgi:hypothetical protein